MFNPFICRRLPAFVLMSLQRSFAFTLLHLQATRPAFIGVTVLACAIGIAYAHHTGVEIRGLIAWASVLGAVLAHAGANVLNDYYDALNGTDAANEGRISPFTGGSRMIQNGTLSLHATRRWAFALFLPVVPLGLYLSWQVGPSLLWLGMAGLFIGWAYSARPLQLMARGLGEVGIVLAWCLMVVGADGVQRGTLSMQAMLFGLMWGLSVATILCINQFPDRQADALAGKNTLVVKFGPGRAAWVYALLGAASFGVLGYVVWVNRWYPMGAAAMVSLALFALAARDVFRFARPTPTAQPLRRAIVLTIVANHWLGAVVVAGLLI